MSILKLKLYGSDKVKKLDVGDGPVKFGQILGKLSKQFIAP